jgi:hypothetical protein
MKTVSPATRRCNAGSRACRSRRRCGSPADYFFSMFHSTSRGVSWMPERLLRCAIGA